MRARRCTVTAVAALLVGGLLPAAAAAPTDDPSADGREVVDQVGRWRVSPRAPGGFTLTWRAPEPLPVTDARPEVYARDALLGSPRLAADGRTLRLVVRSGTAPAVDDLAVVLSGRVLDATGRGGEPAVRGPVPRGDLAAPRGGTPYVAPPPGRPLSVDPGTPGTEAVVTSDYRLPARRIAGMRAPIEMVGHVVRPADASVARPLVLFLHGRHEACFRPDDPPDGRGAPWCPRGTVPVPSHLGYDYAQRLLAGQGYVTVSVAANGINAQDFALADGGARARATLLRRHLAQWARWAAAGRVAVDMDRVVLVGHSRGGEGANQASVETPLGAPYRIVGQVLVAPTNFGRRAAAYVPTVTFLPYCDGDVSDLQGQSFTDLARDLTDDDTALRSSVLMMGANHNFFNTEWTPRISAAPSIDDGRFLPGRLCKPASPSRLSASEQRAVARTYVAGAVALLTGAADAVPAMFDGSHVEVPSAGGADVRTHALGGGRDVRRPGAGVTVAAGSPAAAGRLCQGRAGSARAAICGREMFGFRTPHWVPDSRLNRGAPSAPAAELQWETAGGSSVLLLDRPLDLSAATGLDLRTAVDPALGDVRLRVRVHDGQGRTSELTGPRARLVPALPGRDPFVFAKIWAQTLRVPVVAPTGDADLADVRKVELVGVSDDGRVWVLDLASVPQAPAPVPARRLPRISLGDLRVDEGDGRRRRVASVPFRVDGVVSTPARFVVLGQSFADGSVLAPLRVSLQPGQRGGTLPVSYASDDVDDFRVQQIELAALPVHGVSTSRHLARLRIVDDDPSPRIRFRRTDPRVREGHAARWQVTLSRPVDYPVFVSGRIARGATTLPPLRAGDVPERWLREHVFPTPPPDRPLHETDAFVFGSIPAGRTSTVLRVPLRRDGVREGPESVALRIPSPRRAPDVARSVTVVD